MNLLDVIKKPSAALPVLMSFAALALVLVHVARVGAVAQDDEGAEAHLFQMLLVAQIPITTFFAMRWLPTMPKDALAVLALQACAALIACAPVYLLGL